MKSVLIYKNGIPWQLLTGDEDFINANLAYDTAGKSYLVVVGNTPITFEDWPEFNEENVNFL